MNRQDKLNIGASLKDILNLLFNFTYSRSKMPYKADILTFIKDSITKRYSPRPELLKYLNTRIPQVYKKMLRNHPNRVDFLKFYEEESTRLIISENIEQSRELLGKIENKISLSWVLEHAILNNWVEVVKYMVENTPVHIDIQHTDCIVNHNRQEILSYLYERGFDISGNKNQMMLAALIHRVRDMQIFLVDRGAAIRDIKWVEYQDDILWLHKYKNSKELAHSLSEELPCREKSEAIRKI